MSEWESKKWGDLATLEYGKALRGYQDAEGLYKVFGTNGPIGCHTEALCKHPSVIVGRKGAYRGIHYSEDPFWVIDTAFYLAPRSEFDMKWAYYELLTHDINAMDTGSAIPSTTRDAFYNLEVLLPPRTEQLRIAHILGALDDKIELNRRMNRTLEGIARATFKSWFIDFDPVIDNAILNGKPIPDEFAERAEVRREILARNDEGVPGYGHLFPDEFQDSELGPIPKGCEVKEVDKCITRHAVGKKYEQKTVSLVGKVPVLDQGRSGIIGYHNDEPGILASINKPIAVFANHTCYMRLVTFPFSAIQNVIPFIGKEIDTVWVYYATYGIQPFLEYKGHWPDFIVNKIVVPSKALTTNFKERSMPLITRAKYVERESVCLESIRDALLPKLIKEELRAKDVKTFLKERGL